VELFIRLDGPADLAGQIYQRVRERVLDGRLRPGEALPPSRELAQRLRVSRNTVVMAYDRLVAEGFLTTRVGAGTFVSGLDVPGPAAESTPAGQVEGGLRPRRIWDSIPVPDDLSGLPDYDFRVGVPDARLFPYATWRRLLGRQFRASAVGSGMPCPPAGHWGLRAALARHLRVARGVDTATDDVVVTCGIQQTLDLVGRVLLEPGSCAAVEEPGYIPPRLAWQSQGARVVGVPVDQEGLVVDALPDDARLVYVTASHQLPTGVAMSLRRRMALLSWAHAHDAAVVEDDYDSEFRYTDQTLEPLQSLDRHGRVLYVGSFSKTLLPTLRIGYLIAPPSLRAALHAAKFVSDWHTSLPTQAALADFIDHGALAGHLRRVRRQYGLRHNRIATALAGPLARWLEVIPSAAGLHIGAYLKQDPGPDLQSFRRRASTTGVALFDFAQVAWLGGTRPGLVFGYGAIPVDRIDEGLRRVQQCLRAATPRPSVGGGHRAVRSTPR
jgi:GntR family transcriptional regulator / MocR family aminotransferase